MDHVFDQDDYSAYFSDLESDCPVAGRTNQGKSLTTEQMACILWGVHLVMSDGFASTSALTIPVLLLAGAVELRSLKDVMGELIKGFGYEFLRQIPDFYRRQAEKRPGKIASTNLVVSQVMDVVGIGPYFRVLLPILWAGVLILSSFTEIVCLVALAGGKLGSQWVIITLAVIVVLLLLLIATPVAQTLVVAPRLAMDEFNRSLKGDSDNKLLKEYYDAIKVAYDAGVVTYQQAERVKDAITSATGRVPDAGGVDD